MSERAESVGMSAVSNDSEDADATKYLVFLLGDEAYAVEVVRVEEVLEFTTIARVPRTPDFLLGVINLRGRVLPVMDLRSRLGLEAVEHTDETRLIVINTRCGGEQISLTALADSVVGVLDIGNDAIEPAPRFGDLADSTILAGLARMPDRIVLLMDADRLLTAELLAESYAALKT
ncbi:MAG: purine-binding chemotaxis protein CheW [Spirochaetaceae bacterium]|nr:MAG: purine-binding chemotaxis protein CheW [Spirochaetaceae bacterium]